MFERYTEKARRTIFFARHEASALGSSYIETEHMLLGLLREDPDLARAIFESSEATRSAAKLKRSPAARRSPPPWICPSATNRTRARLCG